MGLPRGEIGYLQSEATGPTRLSWAPGLVLLDCAEVAHTRAKIMWTQTHWEPEGVCAGAGEISSLHSPLRPRDHYSSDRCGHRGSEGWTCPRPQLCMSKPLPLDPAAHPGVLRSPSCDLQLPSSCSCAARVRQGHPMPCPGLPNSDSLAPSSSYSVWKKATHRKPERK